MGGCIRQCSCVHSGALLLSPADCMRASHESTALECSAGTETQAWPSGYVIANGCAGTDPFWHDTKESGRATGGQSNQLRSVNPHSQQAISEQSSDSSVHTHWKLHCVGAGNFSEDRAEIAGSLMPIGSESNSKCGRQEVCC